MPTAAPVAQATTEGLRRQLGLASTTAAVIGGIIAVGIFLTPAGMAKALGSPMWLLVVWIAVGATTLSGALCYGELAGRFPRAGGAYVYLRESYGPRTAFLFGWMCLLVMDPAVTASLATGLGGYFAYIVPLPPVLIKLVGAGVIWALCLLNILSIRFSAGFIRWTTWLKLRPSRLSDGLGVCLSSGIVVEFCSLCRAALRLFAAGTGSWSRSRWRILLFWRMVGCRQDRGRDTRSGPHSSASTIVRHAGRDCGLRRDQCCVSLPRSSGQSHL